MYKDKREMEIWAVKITEPIPDPLFRELLAITSREESKRIGSFRQSADAERALASILLRNAVLGDKLSLSPEQLAFGKSEYGKPYLLNREGLHFNLTHSGIWVAAVIDEQPVGIDIEEIREIDLDIAQRYFSGQEHRDLTGKSPGERIAYFYDLWTLKESYIKALGKGLSVQLGSFTIKKSSHTAISLKGQATAETWHFRQYNIDPGYKLSVCAGSPDFPDAVTVMDINELISRNSII